MVVGFEFVDFGGFVNIVVFGWGFVWGFDRCFSGMLS